MANKKINQLVLKTTIQSTDLFPLGDATTGQLYKKTIAELQAAIGGAVISVNGLVGTVVLDTDDIQELASPTNKYFTDARARAAISLTTSGNSGASTYSSSTGVLNVPTYTLAGLGGITASFLSGGTGITYNSGTGVISYSGTVYTDASIRALVSAGTGLSYNSTTGVFSYSGTVYTDSSVRALISGTAPITYNNTTGAIGITQATTSTNGYLSSTDWNTFNGKQSALTLGNFTEATSSVLTITGGTGAIIGSGLTVQVKLASGSQSGYLSSTDWTTFNSKQNALTNPVTGTGSTGKLVKFTGTSTIGDSILTESSGAITQSATLPDYALNYTDATSYGRIYFSESGTFKAAIQFMGSTFAATARRNALEIVNTTTGDLALGTGDARTFYIKNGGNVGIGTDSPLNVTTNRTSVTINGTSTSILSFGSGGVGKAYIFNDGTNLETYSAGALIYNTAGSERMRITSGGLIGMGTSAVEGTGSRLTVDLDNTPNIFTIRRSGNSNTAAGRVFFQAFNSGGTLINTGFVESGLANSSADGFLAFAANTTERMRIVAGGNILMGTTTDNGERLYVSGSIRATGSITANSDARLKKNIERIENALEKVGKISGYTYNTIYDEDRHAGVIAQEIDLVLPEIVNKGNDGLMGVEYGNISALLIEAIKDLKGQNESLKARLTALEK